MAGMIGRVMAMRSRPVNGMSDGMIGIPNMGRGRGHAVLTERHRHRCVALQREPQRDQHRQDGSPAVHMLSIFHNIWLFQSSEPESGTKVPYLSNEGRDFSIYASHRCGCGGI